MRAEPLYRQRRSLFRRAVGSTKRVLRSEVLERRDLLAAVSIEDTWRTDDFTATGSFTYLYSQSSPNYTDRIPSGTVQITDGRVEFTSPTEGKWEVTARVEGNGSETFNGQSCSSYRAIHIGTMSGDYDDGLLKGTDSLPTSSDYPTYTGPCPKPENPTDASPFNSDLATLLGGTYDETNDLAGFNWNGPYASGTIAVTIPPTAIKYQDTTPTDLVVTAQATEGGLVITGEVVGRHLKPGTEGRASGVTEVELFFTSEANPEAIVGNVSLDRPIEVFWNTLKTTATVSQIGDFPPAARYIMVQIDRADTVSENASNNVQFIPLTDIQLISFEGGDPAQGRAAHQLALTYKIEHPTGDPMGDKPFEVQIVGASNPSAAGLNSVLHSFTVSPESLSASAGVMSLLNEPSDQALRAGTHTLIIDTASLNLADPFADHDHAFIVAVADRDDSVFEVDIQPIDEDNLATFIGFIQDSDGGVAVLRTGSDSADEVVITQPGAVHVDWQGHSSIDFALPSALVVIASGGDDSITADEANQPVDVMLELYGDGGNDTLIGGSGSDKIAAGAGVDVAIGRGGDDVIELSVLEFERIDGAGGHDTVRLLGDGLHLNLTTLTSGTVQSIEAIELGGQQSQVTLTPAAIPTISDGSNRLEIIAPRTDTRINIGSGWQFSQGVITEEGFRHELTKDGATLWIDNSRPWQNPLSQWDVSRDNAVSPFDALLLVNTLNVELSRRLTDPSINGLLPTQYYDVNGDGSVSPIDALFVINFLNTNVSGEGEPMPSLATDPEHIANVDNVSSWPAPGIDMGALWSRSAAQATQPLSQHDAALRSLALLAVLSGGDSAASFAAVQLQKGDSSQPNSAIDSGAIDSSVIDTEGRLEQLVKLLSHEQAGRYRRS